MLSVQASLRIYLAVVPCDMRKSFNGLWAVAQERLAQDPRDGALFVFSNRRCNRIKILYFDGTGVCVWAKRLEKGKFNWPRSAGEADTKIKLAPQALVLLIAGVDLKDGARRAWYESVELGTNLRRSATNCTASSHTPTSRMCLIGSRQPPTRPSPN